jgi:membrane protease YdiL (CAAX protease family)
MITLLNYLKNPIYCSSQKPKAVNFFGLLLIYVASGIPLAILTFIIFKLFSLGHIELDPTSPLRTILIGIIFAPVFEEIFFRSLLKFSKRNIILFLTSVIAVIIYSAFKTKIEFVLFLTGVFIGILCLLRFFNRNTIEQFISSKFKYIFYASALFFGLVHSSNFTGNVYVIAAFSLILGGPQIALGLILGYIRMNYGLIYSILFHMLVNTTILLTLF